MNLYCKKIKGFLLDIKGNKIPYKYGDSLFYCSDGSYRYLKPKRRRCKVVVISYQPERLNETDLNAGAGKEICESLNIANK